MGELVPLAVMGTPKSALIGMGNLAPHVVRAGSSSGARTQMRKEGGRASRWGQSQAARKGRVHVWRPATLHRLALWRPAHDAHATSPLGSAKRRGKRELEQGKTGLLSSWIGLQAGVRTCLLASFLPGLP